MLNLQKWLLWHYNGHEFCYKLLKKPRNYNAKYHTIKFFLCILFYENIGLHCRAMIAAGTHISLLARLPVTLSTIRQLSAGNEHKLGQYSTYLSAFVHRGHRGDNVVSCWPGDRTTTVWMCALDVFNKHSSCLCLLSYIYTTRPSPTL